MKLTYENILNDPSLLARLRTEAHLARSKAIGDLMARSFKRLASFHAPRTRGQEAGQPV